MKIRVMTHEPQLRVKLIFTFIRKCFAKYLSIAFIFGSWNKLENHPI